MLKVLVSLIGQEDSLQIGLCVLWVCPHSLSTSLLSGTSCSRSFMSFPCPALDQPFLQGALLPFSQESYLEAQVWCRHACGHKDITAPRSLPWTGLVIHVHTQVHHLLILTTTSSHQHFHVQSNVTMFISVPPLQYFQLVPESKKPTSYYPRCVFSLVTNLPPLGAGPSPTWMSSSPDSGADTHAQLPLWDSLLPR